MTAAVNAELLEALRKIVAEVSEVEVVPDDTDFRDLGIDSMMAIEIIAEVERTYKLSIPEDEVKTIVNLRSVYSLVASKLGSASAAE